MKINAEYEAFKAHFPPLISEEIRDYIDHTVMKQSRYLFTRRDGKKQFAYCTHCHGEAETNGLKHNHMAICVGCGTAAMIKGSGMGRSNMEDDAYLLYYDKSLINPAAIIARGFYIVRNYKKSYKEVETKIETGSMYLFEPGNSQMYSTAYWGSTLVKRSSVYSEAVNSFKNKYCYHSIESIKAAVHGSAFQYCQWDAYNHEDQVKVFDFAAKYPCMEYLTKLGMRAVVEAKLSEGTTYGAINWSGKSIDKVLRLTKQEAKEWVKLPFKAELLSLYAYQKFKRLGLKLNFEQAHQACDLAEKIRLEFLRSMEEHAPLTKIINYLLNQCRRDKRSNVRTTFGYWKDYISECKELGITLHEEANVFPNNLRLAHEKTSSKIKMKNDALLEAQIEQRARDLERHRFEYAGLVIRAAASNKELFDEGKELRHCVGGYAQNYADAHIALFLIRKVGNPEQPFYTMEVRGGRMVQCRGFKNCDMTTEVEQFVKHFLAEKYPDKSEVRSKSKIQQGVAV